MRDPGCSIIAARTTNARVPTSVTVFSAQVLAQAAQTLGQKMYAEQQAQAQAQQQQGGAQQSAEGESGKKDENVVDAEFTEVKDKKTGS